MDVRLTIGEFSAMTQLSIKMLRRYHDSGLLEPADVDDRTGYRYYAPRQIGTAQTIRRLRSLDMPVREIAAMLDEPDDARRNALLGAHLRRLEERLEQTRISVTALRRLLDAADDGLVIERRTVGDLRVAAITDVLDHGDVLAWYATAVTELFAAVDQPLGPPGALIDTAIFAEERGEITLYLPAAQPPAVGRITPATLPAVELAVVTHRGNHADMDVTYGRLAQWVLAHGLGVGEQVRETYLIGPRDTASESDWATEIGWPVRVR